MMSEKKEQDRLNELLREALQDEAFTPSPALNRQLLSKAEMEENHMKKRANTRLPRAAAAAIACCIVLGGTGTAIAAHRYLTAGEISDHVSDNSRLADAFESIRAIAVNETQRSGEYAFTLFGLVSGSDLAPYVPDEQADSLSEKRTYAAVAIERLDGGAMPENSFCVSPLIGGVDFMTANNGTMDTSLIWFTQDDVTYELMACDDLEIFADRGVWLSVVDQFGAETRAYEMDASTGAYSKKADYDGIAALFKLPLDPAKADQNAADTYLAALTAAQADDAADTEGTTGDTDADGHPAWITDLVSKLDETNINDYFTRQPEYSLTATPDANGWIDFGSVYIESEDLTYTGSSGTIDLMIEPDDDFTVTGFSYGDDPEKDLQINTLTRNADGSFTEDQYNIK